jgi:transposase-like protein
VKLTLAELRRRVQDEHDAYLLLEELRWPGTPVCSHCGHDKAYFLNPKGGTRGTGRPKPDGKRTQSVRRVWKCAKCRKQFSVLTGTIFHGTKVSLVTWLTVMVQMCSAKNGISAREVERMHEVTPETAWYMLHRLREAMKREPLAGLLTGTIVADETFIGGKPGNRHRQGIRRRPTGKHASDHIPERKIPVLTLVNKETGEVRSRVVPDVTKDNLRKAISEQVNMAQSRLHSDGWAGYRELGRSSSPTSGLTDTSYEYVRGGVSTNQVENYFSQLKRSIDGTHHHVSREHLHRYLAEFDFRYSTWKLTDSARMQEMIDQAGGRRLTYQRPTRGD